MKTYLEVLKFIMTLIWLPVKFVLILIGFIIGFIIIFFILPLGCLVGGGLLFALPIALIFYFFDSPPEVMIGVSVILGGSLGMMAGFSLLSRIMDSDFMTRIFEFFGDDKGGDETIWWK